MPRTPSAAKPRMQGTTKKEIALGLLGVKVVFKNLEKTDTETKISANRICPQHREQVKQQNQCASCKTAVTPILAYNVGGKFVDIDPAVIDSLVADKQVDLTIEAVTPLDKIDPIYFKESFFVFPDPEGGDSQAQRYDLLGAALKKTNRAAIGNGVIGRSKSTEMVVIRWSDKANEGAGCLVAHTCRYTTGIRWSEIDMVYDAAAARAKPDPKLLDMAVTVVESLDGPFDPTAVADTFTPALRDLLDKAAAGQPLPAITGPVSAKAEADDVMGDLMKSVEAAKAKKAAKPAAKPRAKKVAA